jgi:hypothetical protein
MHFVVAVSEKVKLFGRGHLRKERVVNSSHYVVCVIDRERYVNIAVRVGQHLKNAVRVDAKHIHDAFLRSSPPHRVIKCHLYRRGAAVGVNGRDVIVIEDGPGIDDSIAGVLLNLDGGIDNVPRARR